MSLISLTFSSERSQLCCARYAVRFWLVVRRRTSRYAMLPCSSCYLFRFIYLFIFNCKLLLIKNLQKLFGVIVSGCWDQRARAKEVDIPCLRALICWSWMSAVWAFDKLNSSILVSTLYLLFSSASVELPVTQPVSSLLEETTEVWPLQLVLIHNKSRASS